MALTNEQLNKAAALIGPHFLESNVDNFSKANPLYARMVANEQLQYVAGGTSIRFPLELAENSTNGWTNGINTVESSDIEQTHTFGQLELAYYAQKYSNSLKDFAEAGDDSGAIRSLIKQTMNASKNKTVRVLSESFFGSSTDNNELSISGLSDVLGASGTAYAGLLDTDFPADAYLSERNTTSIAYADINYDAFSSLVNKLKARGSKFGNEYGDTFKPNLMLSNSIIHTAFGNSLQQQQRFGKEETAFAGFEALKFGGIDYIVDDYSKDNHVYVLSTNTFKVCHKYGFNGKQSPMDGTAVLPNQPIITAKSYLALQLVCMGRRYNGVFTNVQES